MIIAQAPDPTAFHQFWIIIAFLLGVIVNVVTLMKFNKAQKREVSFTFIPASKEEFDRHVAANAREHENMFSKMGGMDRGCQARMTELNREWQERMDAKWAEMVRTGKEDRGAIHDRINKILEVVSEIKGELKTKR